MEFFRIRRTIPFMRYALIFNVISMLTFVAAVYFIWAKGFNFSIEFTGGTVIETRYSQPADLQSIRKALTDKGFVDFQVQNFGGVRDVMIRLPLRKDMNAQAKAETAFVSICEAKAGKVNPNYEFKNPDGSSVKRAACVGADGALVVEITRIDFVGPQVGEELAHDGLMALLAVAIGIAVYLAWRFEWKFAIAGVLANLHDVVIIAGVFAFFQWEFSLPVLAGILAVLGYSVNESVIIFDRVRENFRKMRKAETTEVLNSAITGTISRTIITHGSTQMAVIAMLIWGGPTLHYFALALTIGICFGIYSSVFVAAGLAMWFGVKREDLIKPVIKKEDDPAAMIQ